MVLALQSWEVGMRAQVREEAFARVPKTENPEDGAARFIARAPTSSVRSGDALCLPVLRAGR